MCKLTLWCPVAYWLSLPEKAFMRDGLLMVSTATPESCLRRSIDPPGKARSFSLISSWLKPWMSEYTLPLLCLCNDLEGTPSKQHKVVICCYNVCCMIRFGFNSSLTYQLKSIQKCIFIMVKHDTTRSSLYIYILMCVVWTYNAESIAGSVTRTVVVVTWLKFLTCSRLHSSCCLSIAVASGHREPSCCCCMEMRKEHNQFCLDLEK